MEADTVTTDAHDLAAVTRKQAEELLQLDLFASLRQQVALSNPGVPNDADTNADGIVT